MVQAIMSVFLKVHGHQLIQAKEVDRDGFLACAAQDHDSEGLSESMRGLLGAQQETTDRLRKLVDYGIGVGAFVRGATGVV